jgi:hypothetical protein
MLAVVQIGSRLRRSACGTKRTTPDWAPAWAKARGTLMPRVASEAVAPPACRTRRRVVFIAIVSLNGSFLGPDGRSIRCWPQPRGNPLSTHKSPRRGKPEIHHLEAPPQA